MRRLTARRAKATDAMTAVTQAAAVSDHPNALYQVWTSSSPTSHSKESCSFSPNARASRAYPRLATLTTRKGGG